MKSPNHLVQQALVVALLNASCTGIIEGPADGSGSSGSGAASGGSANGPMPNEAPFTRCTPCHGATGEGTILGYELRHPLRPFSTWVVRNGRSGGEFQSSVMLPYSADVLSDADLVAIFDYLASFPQPTTGEGLYLDYCGNCHGADARGGVVGSNISDKAFNDASEKVRRGEGGLDYGNRAAYMPAFGGDVLSDDELRAITDYLATLRTQ